MWPKYLAKAYAKDINGNTLPEEPKKYWGQTVLFKQRLYGHNTTFNTPKKVLTRKDKTTGEEVEVSIDEQIEEKSQSQNWPTTSGSLNRRARNMW